MEVSGHGDFQAPAALFSGKNPDTGWIWDWVGRSVQVWKREGSPARVVIRNR